MTKTLMTMKQAAQALGISLAQAYNLARLGILPVVHLGRMLRVDPDKLEEFIRTGGKQFDGGWRKEA